MKIADKILTPVSGADNGNLNIVFFHPEKMILNKIILALPEKRIESFEKGSYHDLKNLIFKTFRRVDTT